MNNNTLVKLATLYKLSAAADDDRGVLGPLFLGSAGLLGAGLGTKIVRDTRNMPVVKQLDGTLRQPTSAELATAARQVYPEKYSPATAKHRARVPTVRDGRKALSLLLASQSPAQVAGRENFLAVRPSHRPIPTGSNVGLPLRTQARNLAQRSLRLRGKGSPPGTSAKIWRWLKDRSAARRTAAAGAPVPMANPSHPALRGKLSPPGGKAPIDYRTFRTAAPGPVQKPQSISDVSNNLGRMIHQARVRNMGNSFGLPGTVVDNRGTTGNRFLGGKALPIAAGVALPLGLFLKKLIDERNRSDPASGAPAAVGGNPLPKGWLSTGGKAN